VLALCALVVRQIYRPEEDLVRWSGRVDDPAGGVFDRVGDAPPSWLVPWLRPARLRQPTLSSAAAGADFAGSAPVR
jgi:uncharacterized membrane protein